jgi:hypothetical protein
MAIIIIENGRIGNQLFQYYSLRKLFKDNIFIFIGNFKIKDLIETENSLFISNPLINNFYILKLLNYSLDLLIKYKVISKAVESASIDYKLHINYGLIKGIIAVKDSYFQHYEVIRLFTDKPKIQSRIAVDAINFFLSNQIQPENSVFLHIRRGDYLKWPSEEFSAALPFEWYEKQINFLKKIDPYLNFIICSDDLSFVNKHVSTLTNFYVCNKGEMVDLAVMSSCRHGILSASTYSWWAGYMSKGRFDTQFFLAPRYWIGHKSKIWIPAGLNVEWITYRDVD